MASKRQIAKAFKAAKKYLWKGEINGPGTSYICFALSKAEDNGDITQEQSDCACDVISERLGGTYATVPSWLRERIGARAFNKVTFKQIQAYRHAWLDQLIKEFSK